MTYRDDLAVAVTPYAPPTVRCEPSAELSDWIARHTSGLRAVVHEHGAVLVRGLSFTGPAIIERYARELAGPLMTEREGFAPRSRVGSLYSSAQWPHNEPICMHHELSYAATFPGLLVFACLVAPTAGGAIGLADAATLARDLPAELIEKFERTGWLLTRNYSPAAGVQLAEAFGTDDRDAISAYCRANAIHHEWREGGGLRTTQRRRALIAHPVTGVRCWFNQIAFLNEYTTDSDVREYLRMICGPSGIPINTGYGDGTDIPEQAIQVINETYDVHTRWVSMRAGDLLLVDNVRMAHARQAYRPPREILVAMGGPVRSTAMAP